MYWNHEDTNGGSGTKFIWKKVFEKALVFDLNFVTTSRYFSSKLHEDLILKIMKINRIFIVNCFFDFDWFDTISNLKTDPWCQKNFSAFQKWHFYFCILFFWGQWKVATLMLSCKYGLQDPGLGYKLCNIILQHACR